MRKFNVQDRIVLDEMVDCFKEAVETQQAKAEKDNKRPLITKEYWMQMIDEVQCKLDNFTTSKALKNSKTYRNK
jgi:hypothetical protein